MFVVAACLPIFEMKSPITAHFRLPAHCAASLFLAGVCGLSVLSIVLGNARANKVENESITIRDVFGGGKDVAWCVRRASKCGNVGVV